MLPSTRLRGLQTPHRSKRYGAIALVLLLATALPAQCKPVPGTGCPGASRPICGGSTGVGQSFGGIFVGGSWYLLLGLCADPPIPLGPPITCNAVCHLGVDPAVHVVFVVHGGWSIQIPNDPRLIGATLCYQFAATSTPCLFGCAFLPAIRFTITP